MTIATLPDDERRLIRDLAATGPRRRIYGRCMFCGGLTFGRVCRAHRDLLEVEAEAEPTAQRFPSMAVGSDEEGA